MGKLSKNVTFSDALAVLAIALSLLIPSLSIFGGAPVILQKTTFAIACLLLAIAIFLFVILARRKSPDDIPSIQKSVEHSTQIWGLWWTGDLQYKLFKKPEYTPKYKRILLLDFNNKEFFSNFMTKAAGTKKKLHTQEKVIKQIKRLTKLATMSGIEVKWYSKMQVYSLTLYNPEDAGAYVVKSDLQLESNRKNRRLSWFRLIEDNEKKKTNEYKIEFQQLWENERLSRVPKEEEYV